MINWGTVPAGSVLPFPFDAFGGTNGESITISGLAVTDIEVYKGTSMTQRSSDNGYALMDTDGIDIDSMTGIHGYSIDTGDNTDAGFYSVGSFFWVVVSAITVDSQTVRFVHGTFRLGAAEASAGYASVTVKVGTSTGEINVASGKVPATIAAGDIANSAITANSIASDAITAAKIATGAIDADAIADNAIDAGAIASGAITSAKFAAGAIDATAIADNAIDAGAIASNAITSAKIASGAITSSTFATGAIDAAAIAANAIGASELATDAVAEIADAVWEEAIADHSGTAGSTAEQLAAAGAAGDPWATALPGSYTSGQAGKIVGDNLNATVSSRATQTSVDTIDDFLDTEVVAIKAKTDNLPSDPADASDISALIDALPTAVENADALLARNINGGSSTGRTVKQALKRLRNKVDVAGGTMTVYDEDDSSSNWTAAVTTAAGDPVSSVDPS